LGQSPLYDSLDPVDDPFGRLSPSRRRVTSPQAG
jgi:hypothetical protein